MKDTGTTAEQLAMVAVVQRAWATKNPRAALQPPTTVEEVMNDRMIAYPFTKSACCLVTAGGGAGTHSARVFSLHLVRLEPSWPAAGGAHHRIGMPTALRHASALFSSSSGGTLAGQPTRVRPASSAAPQ